MTMMRGMLLSDRADLGVVHAVNMHACCRPTACGGWGFESTCRTWGLTSSGWDAGVIAVLLVPVCLCNSCTVCHYCIRSFPKVSIIDSR
jgi:hypothetical protein